MARAWMPLYVGDYLADTGHLTMAQHGAYMLLIMHYWQHGGLPNDDAVLAQICRAKPKEWPAIKAAVSGFFSDCWKHERIESELAKAAKIIEAKKVAGKAGNDTRWHRKTTANGSQMGSHTVSQTDPQSQSQSQSQREDSKTSLRAEEKPLPPDEPFPDLPEFLRRDQTARSGGTRPIGAILNRPKVKNQDKADLDMARHLISHEGYEYEAAWALIAAARGGEGDTGEQAAARVALDRISARHKLGWFAAARSDA